MDRICYVQELSPPAYKLSMGTLRIGLADYCLLTDRMQIVGCFSETDEALGFAMYRILKERCDIHCLRARDDSPMVTEALLGAVKKRCLQEKTRTLYWKTACARVPDGFACIRSDSVYRVDKSFAPCWPALKAKFQPIADRHAARGYRTVTLGECTEAQRQEIADSYREEKNSRYLEGLLRGLYGKLLPGLSMVVLKEGHAAAYCIIHAEPYSAADCRLGYLGSVRSCRGAFVAASAFINAMEACQQSDYRALRFTINDKNLCSGNLVRNHMPFLQPRVTIHTYRADII